MWLSKGHTIWLFAGSDTGGERAAIIYSLIVTALTPRRGCVASSVIYRTGRLTGSAICCHGRSILPLPKHQYCLNAALTQKDRLTTNFATVPPVTTIPTATRLNAFWSRDIVSSPLCKKTHITRGGINATEPIYSTVTNLELGNCR